MLKVENKRVLRNIRKKYMESNKRRNSILILAIALSSLLFTSVFSVASILKETSEAQTMRQVGTRYHGSFKAINLDQVEKIKKDPRINSYGLRLFYGMGVNDKLSKTYTEVSYVDQDYAKESFVLPNVGRLPREGTTEMACDREVIEALGLPLELGSQVQIETEIARGQVKKDSFILVGYWDKDPVAQAHNILLPRSYILESLRGFQRPEGNIAGTYAMAVYLDSHRNIEKNLGRILQDKGYQNIDSSQGNYVKTGENWAYMGSSIEQKDLIAIGAILLVFVLLISSAAYMIIYNVFQISVLEDIQFYGLLKTIGTTSRQIKNIVRGQALSLGLVGIPIGLVLGTGFGLILSKRAVKSLSFSSIEFRINLWAYGLAIVFTFLTILLSARRPAKRAARVSPVEAVKFQEGQDRIRKKTKRSRKQRAYSLAWANTKRNKKSLFLVALSLALALGLFQSSINLSQGFSLDKYLDQALVSDFIISKAGYFNPGIIEKDKRSVDGQEAQGLENDLSLGRASHLYFEEGARLLLEEATAKKQEPWLFEEGYRPDKVEGKYHIGLDLFLLNPHMLSKLEVFKGSLEDLDRVKNGVIALYRYDDKGRIEEESSYLKLGDRVQVLHPYRTQAPLSGEVLESKEEVNQENLLSIGALGDLYYKKDYQVVACAAIKYPMSARVFGPPVLAMKEGVLRSSSPFLRSYAYHIDLVGQDPAQVEKTIRDYCQKTKTDLNYESKFTFEKEFGQFKTSFVLVGMSLSLVLGIIGVLNLYNGQVSSILARRKEWATLQAIGMTKVQARSIILMETFYLLLLSGGLGMALSMSMNYFLLPRLEDLLNFYQARYSLLGLLFLWMLFLLLGMAISLKNFEKLQARTLVERLK